jgi:hypothetical protein
MVQNWNWCLCRARGEFIKFVFGDDKLVRPDALRKMVAMLEANPGAAMAVCARQILDEQSRVVEVWDHFGGSGVYRGGESIFRCLVDGNLIGEPSVVMFPRGLATRGFSASYHQLTDLEMWLHLLERGSLVYTSETLCAFRKHAQQRTESNKLGLVDKNESVRLALEYGESPALKNYDRRKILASRLYGSRKFSDPGVTPDRALLMGRLGRFWYAAYWLRHKLTKPILNLSKALRRASSR